MRQDTADGFIREIMRDALWQVAYHERELNTANRNSKFVEQLLERCNFTEFTVAEIIEDDCGDDDKDDFDDLADFTRHILSRYLLIKHHENELSKAFRELAFAKIMLARGRYTGIDVAEIQKEVESDLEL